MNSHDGHVQADASLRGALLAKEHAGSVRNQAAHPVGAIGIEHVHAQLDLHAREYSSPLSSARSLPSQGRAGHKLPGEADSGRDSASILHSSRMQPEQQGLSASGVWHENSAHAVPIRRAHGDLSTSYARGMPAPVSSVTAGHQVSLSSRSTPLESGFGTSPMTDGWLTPRGAPLNYQPEPRTSATHDVRREAGFERAQSLTPRDVIFEAGHGQSFGGIVPAQASQRPQGLREMEPARSSEHAQSPQLSTSFLAALRGQGAPPAPRRSGGRAERSSGAAAAENPPVRRVPNQTAPSQRQLPAGEPSASTASRRQPGQAAAPAGLTAELRSMRGSGDRPTDESRSLQRPSRESSVVPAVGPAGTTRASGFSRAQALLAAIERSIREHPPCGFADQQLFSAGPG